LVELAVVIAIMAMISAIVLPELFPVIAFSRAEGAARHLAGYGKSAMAHTALLREAITIKFDIGKGEYWAIRQAGGGNDLFSDDEAAAAEGMKDPGDSSKKSDAKSGDTLDLMGKNRGAGGGIGGDPEVDPFRDRFERFARVQLEARARKLNKDGILSDVGPLFDKPFKLDDKEDENQELKDPLLTRTILPDGVTIDGIRVGGSDHSSGEVDVEFSATGLDEPVVFYVKSEDAEYFTVVWDPITGTAHFKKGRQEYDSETMQQK
jgi:type II secretory pathway pseudopilin PulG